MIFKTHAYNIPQIKAALKKYDAVWFHGDGNLYVAENDSKNHRDFVNPKQEEAKYRYKFTSVSQLPPFVNGSTKEETERLNAKSVDKLNEMLMASRNVEIREERKSEAKSTLLDMDMHDDLQPSGKKPEVLAADEHNEDDEKPTQNDFLKTMEARMQAMDEKMASLDSKSKELDQKAKELDKKSAELDKKAAELNKKAQKGTPDAEGGKE